MCVTPGVCVNARARVRSSVCGIFRRHELPLVEFSSVQLGPDEPLVLLPGRSQLHPHVEASTARTGTLSSLGLTQGELTAVRTKESARERESLGRGREREPPLT